MTRTQETERSGVRDVPIAATVCLVAIGVLFIALGVLYFMEPARNLPGLIPGSKPGLARHHVKHGIASVAVGAAVLLSAAFSGSSRDSRVPRGGRRRD